MYAPQGPPAVFPSVLASSVIIVAARAGLLSPCVIPALCLRIHFLQSLNEMPPAQIDRIVQGVYFALKRRGLNIIKALPSFRFYGQKQGKMEHYIVADLREIQENQGL